MGSFALGSRIYLFGGEVGLHHEVDFVHQGRSSTQRISNKVCFFDTAASVSSSPSSPLSVAPPMQGGKRSPLAIHVHGMVYVISDLPSLHTYYREEQPLFEVFDPQSDEVEGKWSPLPRPAFYRLSSYHESDDINRVAMIVSHAVFGSRIFFFTNKKDPTYAFNVNYRRWTSLKVYNGCNTHLPFREVVTPLFDHVWAAIDTSPCRMSPISTFDLCH
ncbi:uncharacterized protein LOC131319218 [Rhododendron vialii]|uniref:uncharacterized protein LOC131319218 n=1 Tax=Rhododendron vialii TaxID=182163 RepID=UPI0026604380|nr:uncharacterized protein LOC131319218 [Rhododendron vialii]